MGRSYYFESHRYFLWWRRPHTYVSTTPQHTPPSSPKQYSCIHPLTVVPLFEKKGKNIRERGLTKYRWRNIIMQTSIFDPRIQLDCDRGTYNLSEETWGTFVVISSSSSWATGSVFWHDESFFFVLNWGFFLKCWVIQTVGFCQAATTYVCASSSNNNKRQQREIII